VIVKEILARTTLPVRYPNDLFNLIDKTDKGGEMFVPAPLGRRITGGIIDYVVLMLLAIVIALIFGCDWRYATFFTFVTSNSSTSLITQIQIIPTIISAILYLGYFIIFEGIARTSVGKTLMSMTIVKEDGNPIGFREAIIRTLFRGIDGAPLWYITGLIVILLSPTRQRIGDHAGQAVVVEKATVENKRSLA